MVGAGKRRLVGVLRELHRVVHHIKDSNHVLEEDLSRSLAMVPAASATKGRLDVIFEQYLLHMLLASAQEP